ncbi:MAG: NUDIX hydrolase [Bacteroidales bacterium]|nr:NUDIX hydrolase [Bacteroidales bacterium]
MIYTYAYPRPAVTVDIIVFKKTGRMDQVLLIERKNPPFKDCWALPGGFVDKDEDLEKAACRELKEETSIEDIALSQLHTFGKPGRDPRGHTISVVYTGILNPGDQKIQAGDDAKNLQWFSINQLPELAFDHREIIEYAVANIIQ